ncbi:Hypothetical predicted protein [Mytilus galloprovincialis]|uniref:Novel STAND NTPase 3 domain-containing protein n=1 Tax=Mytilus galloprovincialis TaxID=29158 RepID=A0A8B6D823_MYTGA|nr:Hypothetical predicted protein [Mytilus galloprovincialis]
MANTERDNFFKGSILIVDNTKASFVDLLELHLSRNKISFEDFINQHQHQIYHLFSNKKTCCQCLPGFKLPNNRVLNYSQLELLFDKRAKKHCHSPRNSNDFCCARTTTGISTDLLDITFIRVFLTNFCHDVFWYSCLVLTSLSLEDFLNQNKHHIYHLMNKNQCCQCPTGYTFPVSYHGLGIQSWRLMFNLSQPPCSVHRTVPGDCVCAVAASPGIDVTHLGDQVNKLLIEQCCPLTQTINRLVTMRNKLQGHPSAGRISDADYGIYKSDIESDIMEIAKVCQKEASTKQSLLDVSNRSLDETLCIQYQNILLEQILQDKRLEKKIDEIPESIQHTLNNSMSDIVEQFCNKINSPEFKLTEDTLTLVQSHTSQNTFVSSNAINVAMRNLEDNGVQILTGTAGTGKSRNCLELLRQYIAKHAGYHGIKLQKVQEWRDLICIDDFLVVLFDDIFGQTSFNFIADDEHVFETINSVIEVGNVKVIFTIRNSIKSEPNVASMISRQHIFKRSIWIDLNSDEMTMNEEQKENMLLKHCAANKILPTYTESDPNKDERILDPSVTMYILRSEIRRIVKIESNPLMGFPLSCYLFASDRKLTRLGVIFFKHTSRFLCDEIHSLRVSGEKDTEKAIDYAILVYVMMNDDLIKINDLPTEKINKVLKTLYKREEISSEEVRNGLERLTQRYLKRDVVGVYSFQHRIIFEGVLLSYKDIDDQSLITILDFDFIVEMGCTEQYLHYVGNTDEVVFIFREKHYKSLVQRILSEFKTYKSDTLDFLNRLCSSRIMRYTDTTFLDELYSEYLKSTCNVHRMLLYFRKNWDYEVCIREYNDGVSPCLRQMESFLTSLLFNSLKYIANDDAIKTILKYMERELHVEKNNYVHIGYSSCFSDGILQACIDSNERRLSMLVDFVKKYNIKCHSFHISQRITVPMLRFLLSHPECDVIDINVLLFEAIKLHDTILVEQLFKRRDAQCIDIVPAMRHACTYGRIDVVMWFCERFSRDDLQLENALEVTCFHGKIEIVKMLCTRFNMDVNTLDKAFLEACKQNKVGVLSFMFENFQTDIFDLNTAMRCALSHHCLETITFLIENTIHPYRTQNLLEYYKKCITYSYSADKCFYIIKYLITVNSHFDIDVLLTIAKIAHQNFEIVEWVSKFIDVKTFYIASTNHKWIHKNMCVLKREYETGFYMNLNEEDVITEEIKFGNTDCIFFLFEKFEIHKIDKKLIMERICIKREENLLKFIFDEFGCDYLDITSVFQTALREDNLNIVKWVLKSRKNRDILDLNFIRKGDGISLFTSLLEAFSESDSDWNTKKHEIKSSPVNQYLQKLLSWYSQDNINLCKINQIFKWACKNQHTGTVYWLLKNFGHQGLHLNSVLEEVLMSKKNEYLQYLFETVDTTIFDMQAVINHICSDPSLSPYSLSWMHRNLYLSHSMIEKILHNACESRNISLVKSILKECNPNEFDMKNLMTDACQQGSLELVQLIYRFHSLASLSMETVFTHACNSNNGKLVKWWFQRIDPLTFDYKLVVKNITSIDIDTIIFLIENFDVDALDFAAFCTVFCSNHTDGKTYELRLQLQLCLLESYTYNAINIVDIKSVFDQICYSMSVLEAKWIVSLVDHKRLNFISATLEAIEGNNTDTALFLLKSMDHEDLEEVNSIFTHACVNGNCTVVNFLIDRFDKCLNVIEVFESSEYNNDLCVPYFKDILKVIFKKLQVETSHKNVILHTACRIVDVEFVKWLIKNVDKSVLDLTKALKIAFSEIHCMSDNNIGLIQCLLEYSKPSFTDCHLLMRKTCLTGESSHLTWLLKCFDPDIFEVRSAILYTSMNKTDPGGTPDKIRFILSSCQCIHSDIKFAFNIACTIENVSLMEWIVDEFDSHTLDLQYTLKIALKTHVNEEILQFLFDKQQNLHLDLQNAFDNACLYKRISAVNWLFDNFNLNVNVNRAIQFCLKKSKRHTHVNMEGEIFDILKLLFQLFDAKKFNILFIIQSCFEEERGDLVLWILQVCDHSLFDIQKVLCEVCRHGEINCAFYLLHTRNYGKYVNQECLLNAFASGIFENATKLITVFPDVYFDIKIAMNDACLSGNLSLVQWLFYTYTEYVRSNFDLKSAKRKFDLDTAMINACKKGKTDVVQWLLQLFLYETFDMESAFNNACGSGSTDMVKWMLGVYDHETFNIKSAMTCACQNGRLKVVQCLIENFSTNAFDMETVMNEAVGSGDICLVRWLHKTIESKLYNIKAAMIKACLNNKSDVVRWILDNFDHSYFNMQMVTIAACDWGRIELV